MKYLIVTLLIIGFTSCQESKPIIESIEKEDLTSQQIDSILTEFKFDYESPIVLDSTDYVLIPISTELFEPKKVYSRDGYYPDDYPRYWNILFYNRKTGDTRLLTEGKTRISHVYAIPGEYEQGRKTINGKVLYEIGDIDYDKDNKLNSKDPEFLFVSEINGQGLT